MSYMRVIPRDLFNEAKLLKCLGQVALIIHDGVGVPSGLHLEHDTTECDGFNVEQDPNDGSLYCGNLSLYFEERLIGLRSPYNSKDAYPLRFTMDDEEGDVLTYDGFQLSSALKLMINSLSEANA